ncbi:MAG TPA: prepilin-type N-terminal cleavage/methylation domain-containing protein [Planctomycetota bacterium]|nr:prepilin-type N-terminal cleavage/methylation domain-containing protein [Planctomycetota bacterium]
MRARQTGFTLIELILVMLIACVVMAITAPSLRNFLYGRKTANAVSQIVSLASEARSKAIMDGRTYRLNVDTTAGTFWLDAQNGGDFKELGTEASQHYSLPDGAKAQWVFPDGADSTAPTANSSSSNGIGGGGSLGLNLAQSQSSSQTATAYVNNGMSVRFYSDGRCEGGTLVVTDSLGSRIELGAPSESEQWKVMKEDKTN